jgi:hypothetical protein
MWQNWQNKILREAAKFGYKSEEAEFYEQELDEQAKTIKGVKFEPFKTFSFKGWEVHYPNVGMIGFVKAGVKTRSTTTPSGLYVMDKSKPQDGGYNLRVLNVWPESAKPHVTPTANIPNLFAPPGKTLDVIAQWLIQNPNKI